LIYFGRIVTALPLINHLGKITVIKKAKAASHAKEGSSKFNEILVG
jgi:hypothetical protein